MQAAEGLSDDTSMTAKLNEIFTSKYNRQALIIGVGLVLFQQLSGQPSVLYFANRIFEKVGFYYLIYLYFSIYIIFLVINPRRVILIAIIR
jgi:hypothetical protein